MAILDRHWTSVIQLRYSESNFLSGRKKDGEGGGKGHAGARRASGNQAYHSRLRANHPGLVLEYVATAISIDYIHPAGDHCRLERRKHRSDKITHHVLGWLLRIYTARAIAYFLSLRGKGLGLLWLSRTIQRVKWTLPLRVNMKDKLGKLMRRDLP